MFNVVLAAPEIAFGFVFIHPYADGNDRIHRYLIHRILSKMQIAPRLWTLWNGNPRGTTMWKF